MPISLHLGFLRRGMDSRLICAEGSAIAVRFGGTTNVVILPFRGVLDRVTRRALVREMRNRPPRVILCHFSHDLPLLRLVLTGIPGVKLFLIKHVGPGKAKRDLIHRWVYGRVNRVLGVSAYIADRCREAYPIKGDQAAVWHPGVDIEKHRFRPGDRSHQRGKLPLKDNDILFGYVARHTPGKGHLDLVEAFTELAAGHGNVFLALPGSASADEREFADRLSAKIKASPAGPRIILPGFVEDVPVWLSAFDAFINPSPREAFGLNTIEAMAAGRPVVTTSGGGSPDIITNGENGLLVEPDSIEELRKALVRLTEDADLRQRLGQAARQTVESRFSFDSSVDRLLQFMR